MNRKLDFIDALRGYAILAVVLTHVTPLINNLPKWLENIGAQGARGVQLFFVVSAFTLMFSLHNKYASNAAKIELGDFFIKRFFRIAPAFYLALICYSAVDILTYQVGISNQTNGYNVGSIFSALTFTNLLNIEWLYSLVPGGWSISAEMLFYLTVPVFFILIKNLKSSIYLTVTTIVIGMAATTVAFNLSDYGVEYVKEEYYFHWFPNQLPVFCFGIMLYFVLKSKDVITGLAIGNDIKYSNFILSLSIIGILTLSILNMEGVLYFYNHILFSLFFAGLAYGLAGSPKKIFVNKTIVFIGKISFSMYLIHFLVVDIVDILLATKIQGLFSDVASVLILYLVTLIISIPLSYLSHIHIENRGVAIGRKVSKELSNRRMKKKELATKS